MVFFPEMLTKCLCIALAASSCAMADFVNGGFSTGDLTGWTHFVTTNGKDDFGDVTSFDTTGGGASFAARFEVGQVVFTTEVQEGAGIRQSLFLQPGTYTLSADIASLGNPGGNNAGGLFTAFLGSSAIDTFDFGSISAAPATERSARSIPLVIGSAGNYLFSFQFTRPFMSSIDTPDNYIDNIKLSGGPASIPEPSTWTLAALGIAAFRLRRYGFRSK